ncbi:MAG: DUF697 domain-containing protein [Pirellulales bacterium]
MKRPLSGLFLLVAVATVGYLLLWAPPQILAQYKQVAELSPAWGRAYLIALAVFGVVIFALGGSLLWRLARRTRAKRVRKEIAARLPSQMSAAEKEREIIRLLADSRALVDDPQLAPELRAPIQAGIAQLADKLERQRLEIVAFGTISSGKSSLLNALAGRDVFRTDPRGGTTVTRNEIPWPGDDQVTLVDTPGLAEVRGAARQEIARQAASAADLVLFVVDGPLKDFEYDMLVELAKLEKPLIVCLNKDDWFSAADRARLREQLAEQVQRVLPTAEVITLRARPTSRTRVRVTSGGEQVEEQVELEPDISALAQRMLARVGSDSRELLLANLLWRSRGLVADAKQQVLATLDARAQQIVDRTMWQAGGVAALSPLPVIDVAGALAISVKMVLDLAKVYGQPIDLDTAQRLVGELGKNLLSILGSNLAAPALGTAIASMLKTVPGVGTIAGGVLQGLVQALVTRWIGQVFIEYFRNEMKPPAQGWQALAQAKWQQVTRAADLVQFVRTGLARLAKPARTDDE